MAEKRTRMRAVNPDDIEIELFATMSLRDWESLASALMVSDKCHSQYIDAFRRQIHSVTGKMRAAVEADAHDPNLSNVIKPQAD